MKKFNQRFFLISLLFLAAILISGCSQSSNKVTDPVQPTTATEKLTLYFGDNQAEYLIPETREIQILKDTRSATTVAEAIVKELIAGPTSKDLISTIPKETKLLSVKIENQIAYVDFNEEIKTKHPGGSAGETMTIYSLVNSLTELPEITKVQILINGKKIDTLVEHADLTQPISRDESKIKK